MAQLYSPAWASPAVAVAPSPRKVVAGIALADGSTPSSRLLLVL